MAKKSKLGKGIDALMEDPSVMADFDGSTGQSAAGDEVIKLDPELLKPNPFQPRKTFNQENLRELADSIREHGIIQPIIAGKNAEGEFFIIAGERRTRASILAGLKEVPVVLREFDNAQKLEVALIENIQREDLNPIEEALAYQSIMQMNQINQEETAKKIGKSRSTVANALRLLKLPEEMQNAIEDGRITAGHARAILSLVNPADMQILFNRITSSNLSVRDAENQAAVLNKGGRIAKKETADSFIDSPKKSGFSEIKHLEQQLIDALGTKVQIKGDIEKGVIYISYFTRDDLDSIYEKLSSE
ncbi:ParB/RepB/Spo0J family partition protein [Treponema phagedenis]|uniref:ParB/RepB/Spo0J family partition protein n=1 Tax=Treponema phagedenis TaxID=162 RepID=UPI0001F637A8|nr:ParB/RepB/Spo0J family partition protein [Treponema phagedenis]EFW36896.1 ParB-like protein [Treponema phagedenis F0421]QEK06103.1 ParB/RepB/Spo0J family partition protein [Treponema phagedenis]TYT76738.1 ParB/RepB/Spo0J family partition protein [Treponema phagedenis]TYT76814.1 ParB/RepB/Spo0J family partition protein [Treponema phagedenis]